MTGNKIITVHSKRREHRTHRAKRKAHKQSDDYHNGYINSADKPHPIILILTSVAMGQRMEFGLLCRSVTLRRVPLPVSAQCCLSKIYLRKCKIRSKTVALIWIL